MRWTRVDEREKAQVRQNKAIRGYIIRCLVKGYNNSALTRQVSNAMIAAGLVVSPDISKYLDYLLDAGYIEFTDGKVTAYNAYANDAVIRLTKGVWILQRERLRIREWISDGKAEKKTRISSKIDELPEIIRTNVDVMLADTSNTYQDISVFLKSQGYEISKSSVGRYAMRSNSAMQRLLEAQQQTEKLVQVVKQNPDADYTEAGMRMLMDGLINKMATAEEEFDQMPLDKAGRLLASLSRDKSI